MKITNLAAIASFALSSLAISAPAHALTHFPNANAGGPYAFTADSGFTIDGSSSFSPDGSTLTFAWDLNNDGLFTDASTPTYFVPAHYFGTPAVGSEFILALKVTDAIGLASTSYATAYVVAGTAPAGVPEAATWAMMLIGFGGIGAAMRRNKKAARVHFAFA